MITTIMDEITTLDTELFYTINGARNNFFDWFFAIISSHLFFGIVLVSLILWLSFTQFRRRFWVLLILVALCFLLADRLSVVCFKDVVQRLRPSHALANVHLVKLRDFGLIYGSKGGLYGFVSSHAANVFCLSTVFALIAEKKRRKILIPIFAIWSLLTIYSRVYCGVHYPGDVICGSLLGIVLGLIIFYAYRFIIGRLDHNKN